MAEAPSAALLSAVVIGGTGAVGNCLVGALLKSKDSVDKVALLTRRKVTEVPASYGVDVSAEETSGRLVQHVEDLDAVSDDTVKQLCTGKHVFFNCLGTTRSRAGSAEAFRHIDKEIPLRIAQLAQGAGVAHCSSVSSWGAKANSWFLYLKTKGEIDDAMMGMGFSYTSIFRPGVLDRGVENRRFGERFALLIQRGMPVGTVAQAMLLDAIAYHTKPAAGGEQQQEGEASASTPNVLIANNSRINAICQESVPKETASTSANEN